MLQRFKSMKGKPSPKPLNLEQADKQGIDAFFGALLKSCATPTTPVRTSFSGYESTPEPIGYQDPGSLHRRLNATLAVPESKYYRTSDGLERELLKPPQPARPGQWPTRTSSIYGSERYANNYQHLVQNDQERKHPPSSLTSVETNEEPFIEDGYDHYSEKRREVLRNHDFLPRLRRDYGEPLQMPRTPMQDYDRRPPSLRREDAFSIPTQHSSSHPANDHQTPPEAKIENSFDLRGSVLFKSQPAPEPDVQSISDFLSVEPSTIGLVPRPLFSRDQPPSRWSHSDSSLASESMSELSLSFKDTSVFSFRGGAHEGTPLTPWQRSYDAERPPFKDTKLEEYRLAELGLLRNFSQSMPGPPYLHLSWSTLSPHEYLMALGYHAFTQRLELPLIYAARSNLDKQWTEEKGVAVEMDKFNDRVEEMCKVELATIERMNERDGKMRKEFRLAEAWERKGQGVRLDYSIGMPTENVLATTTERMKIQSDAVTEVSLDEVLKGEEFSAWRRRRRNGEKERNLAA